VCDVAFRTAKKVVAILEKKGRSVDGASNDEAESEIEPALLSCYDIAGRAPKTRMKDSKCSNEQHTPLPLVQAARSLERGMVY
jgi:hypothetical protein